MSANQSISNILASSLSLNENNNDIFRELDNISTNQNNSTVEVSTSSILVAELKRRKEVENNVIKIVEKPFHIGPLFEQIASSQLEAPTYWKGVSQKSKSDETNKQPNFPSGNKRKLQKKMKGESYTDRQKERLSSSLHKKQRLVANSKIY